MSKLVKVKKYSAAVFEGNILTTSDLVKRWKPIRRISEGTLRNWRVMGKGPEFVRIFGRVFYPIPAVENWERNNGSSFGS